MVDLGLGKILNLFKIIKKMKEKWSHWPTLWRIYEEKMIQTTLHTIL